MDISQVSRFEVIDENGRAYVTYDVYIELSLQDDAKTLKVFVQKKGVDESRKKERDLVIPVTSQ